MSKRTLVVVSHYARRSKGPLNDLIQTLAQISDHNLIVINDDSARTTYFSKIENTAVLVRPNLGMNIGGWNSIYKNFPDYENYIFLQDECVIENHNFINAYEKELAQVEVGLTGESVNFKWDRPWNEIAASPLNYPADILFRGRKLSRVEHYLLLMKKWNVNPGLTGRHLRALVWAFTNKSLAGLDGFPIGNDKEECIAAEIAVSKKIEELGLLVTQIAEKPFTHISHSEWRPDGLMKLR